MAEIKNLDHETDMTVHERANILLFVVLAIVLVAIGFLIVAGKARIW